MTLNMFFRDVFQNCELRNEYGGVNYFGDHNYDF